MRPVSRIRRPFLQHQLVHLALSLAVLAFSLTVKVELSEPGKLFAGLYALYCGLVVIAVTGLLLAPGIHHLM